MPDTYISQFSGEEIDAALRAAQIISGASTPAELRKKLEIRGDTIPVSATGPTPISEALTTSGGGINPNLLDNWYFGRPVNQRGQTEYTGSNIYCIDRFICYSLNVNISNSCLKLSSAEYWYSRIGQKIEPNLLNALSGKQVTMTALLKSAKAGQVKISLYDSTDNISSDTEKIETTTGDVQLVTTTFTIPPSYSNHKVEALFYSDYLKNGQETELYALKLELGDTQTLAHQDSSGNWILNEIPDFGEQLRRCTYYAEKVESEDTPAITNSTYVPSGATSAVFILPYARKRTVPAINFNDVSNYRIVARSISGATTAFFVTAISPLDVGRTKAAILVSFNATDQGFYCFLQCSDNAPAGYAFISADL